MHKIFSYTVPIPHKQNVGPYSVYYTGYLPAVYYVEFQ